MNTTRIGRTAEDKVAQKLETLGCEIVSQNWRTRYCEIDIVAKKGHTIVFVEVKYRSTINDHTIALQSIDHHKLRKMKYAAELWAVRNSWNGQLVLAGAVVNGSNDILLFRC